MKRIFLFVCTILYLTSCKTKTAVEFNDFIIKKEAVLIPLITSTEDSINNYAKRESYDSVVLIASKLESEISKVVKEIEEKPLPDAIGAKEFKAAGLKYYNFMKSVYTQYKVYGNAASEIDRNNALEKMNEIIIKRDDILARLQDAQKKYAGANGFRIEENSK